MMNMWETESLRLLAGVFILLQGVSIIFMMVLLAEYGHISRKRKEILTALGNSEHLQGISHGVIVRLLYIVFTCSITVIMAYLFFFQPHLL